MKYLEKYCKIPRLSEIDDFLPQRGVPTISSAAREPSKRGLSSRSSPLKEGIVIAPPIVR